MIIFPYTHFETMETKRLEIKMGLELTCDLKPCSRMCEEEIKHGATTTGVNGCPPAKGKTSGCISIHPNASVKKKDTATNNALSAKIQASSKPKSLVTA